MGIFQNNLMGAAAAAASASTDFYDYQIANSCKFMTGVGYFTRTPSGAGNRKKYTISFWIKRHVQTTSDMDIICNAQESSTTNYTDSIRFSASGNLQVAFKGTLSGNLITTRVFRDTSAWMHVVCAVDTEQGTAADRAKLYINGVQETTFSTETYPAEDYEGGWCNSREHALGRFTGASYTTIGNFYLANFALVDGSQLAPTSFGTSKNGVWIPDDLSELTWGTTGTWVRFESSGDLGNDSSGNNNDWTNNSVAAHDQMKDSPTFGSEGSANFPTINVGDPTITTSAISEGNLKITEGNNLGGKATFAVPLTGKWYWEAYCYADTAQEMWNGITGITADSSGDGRGGSSDSNTYGASWSQYSGSNYYIRKYIAGTESAVSGSFGTTKHTILGIAVNRDDNEIKFYKDNALQITNAISATQEYFPAGGMGGGTNATTIQVWNFGQDGTFAGEKTAQGNSDGNGYGDFYYTPPTGHLALCAANLPTAEEIDPAKTDDDYPQQLFQALTYTGTGSSGSITTRFQPDLIWMKNRGTTKRHYVVDSNRGLNSTSPYIHPDQNVSEGTGNSTGVSGVSSTSISFGGGLDYVNASSNTYVSWHWRANGGTTSTNESGTIDSTVQVDPSECFSIITYTGDNTNSTFTVGHGLSAKPTLIIAKDRDQSRNWSVWSQHLNSGSPADGDTLYLNTTAAETDQAGSWDVSNITSTLIGGVDGGFLNTGTNKQMFYAFTDCEGYIKSGTYEGVGNTDGAFVYTGFRPAFVMTKMIDGSAEWTIFDDARDTYNLSERILQADLDDAERTDLDEIDILSNGFKCRYNGGRTNQSSKNYIYLAIAHNPFKYATAR